MSIVWVSWPRSSTCLRSTIQSQRHGSSNLNPTRLLHETQSLPFPSTNNLKIYKISHITTSRDSAIYSGQGLGSDPSPDPQTPWTLWVIGILMTTILRFWKNKWWGFLKLKENVEEVVDAVDDVAEVVETTAEGVKEVAEEVAEHLPDGGKLQKAALSVENVAERVVKGADLVEEIINKLREWKTMMVTSLFKQNGETKEEKEAKKENDSK